MLPVPSCSAKTSQSKVLAYHWRNYCSTTDSMTPFLHSQSSTSHNGMGSNSATVQHRKEILHHHNAKIVERYNKYTHNLLPLQAGDTIAIQSKMEHDGKNHHSLTWSSIPNQGWQIRKDHTQEPPFPQKVWTQACTNPNTKYNTRTNNSFKQYPILAPQYSTSPCNGTHTAIEPPKQTTYTSPCLRLLRIPQALSRLLPHNWPGLKEGYCPHTTQPTCAGGEERCRSHYSNVQNKQQEQHLLP